MPKRSPGARPAHRRRSSRERAAPRLPDQAASGRLHLALLASLALAALIVLALPIAPSRASSPPPAADPAALLARGLSGTLRAQAAALTGALAEGAASPASSEGDSGLAAFPGSSLLPRPVLSAAGRLLALGALASPDGQPPLLVRLGPAVPFTVHDEGWVAGYSSPQPTVGRALAALGIELGPADIVWPAPDAPLRPGLHVYIDRALRVELSVGGEERTVYTHAATVAELLAEEGITLEGRDRVSPWTAAPLRDGMAVEVTLVREAVEVEEEPIPYDTLYRDDPDLPRGEYRLVQAGSDGYVRREYRVVYENGEEVSRELLREETVPPVPEVLARGTGPPPTYVMPTPDGDLECARKLTVYATWYTAASAGGVGITATGTGVAKGIVAVDPRVIPLGTRMYIRGYGYGVAADTGGGIIGNMIDLGYGPNDVYDWSTGWVEICILD